MQFDDYNNKQESSFTSTGEKIYAHHDAINDLRKHRNHPIVLHIMPTEICNLRCVFCSVAQRGCEGKTYPDLTLDQIKHVVNNLKKNGLKAIILSGGGEPTLYPQINELISFLKSEDLEIGMITNGTLLATHLSDESLNSFTWIRISINTLDYLADINIPKINSDKTTLGFSYIWNPLTKDVTIKKIKKKIDDISAFSEVNYVRLLPDCNLETNDLEKAHEELHKIAQELGSPFFHQYKTHETPPECHLGRVHPVLYTDGFIYPCDSLVLNSPAEDKKFHQDYSLCYWDEVDNFFNKEFNSSLLNTKKCPHCVFARQNLLLTKLINSNDDLPDVDPTLKHVNFI